MSVQLGTLLANLENLGFATDTQTQQIYFLNEIQREVCSGDRWPFLEARTTQAISAGATSFTLGTTPMQWSSVRFTDSQNNYYNTDNIEPQAMEDLRFTSDPDVIGPPAYWSLIGNTVQIWPTADAAYTAQVIYTLAPSTMASMSDTMALPDEFQDVLVYGAAKRMAARERDIYSEQTFDGDYQRKLQKMRQAYLLRQTQTSSKVVRSGVWDRYRGAETGGYPWTSWGE